MGSTSSKDRPASSPAPPGGRAQRLVGGADAGAAGTRPAAAADSVPLPAHGGAPDREPLDDFFPYLVNLITQSIAVHFQKTARPFGVTIERWRVLYVLMRRGDLRASQLSARTGIEASTLSHLLNRMARDDLVTRNREDGDGRAVRVGLTEAGRALAERMLPFALQYEAVALSGMDTAEAAQLKATLRRIAHNLEALDAVIVAPSRPSSD